LLVTDLTSLEAYESALEAYALARLEEQRTGRVRSTAAWESELLDASATAREALTPDAAAAAVARATKVDVSQRARRTIELAEATVAVATGNPARPERPRTGLGARTAPLRPPSLHAPPG
jgi:threonine synthase